MGYAFDSHGAFDGNLDDPNKPARSDRIRRQSRIYSTSFRDLLEDMGILLPTRVPSMLTTLPTPLGDEEGNSVAATTQRLFLHDRDATSCFQFGINEQKSRVTTATSTAAFKHRQHKMMPQSEAAASMARHGLGFSAFLLSLFAVSHTYLRLCSRDSTRIEPNPRMSKAVFCAFVDECAGRAMQMDSDLLLFESVLPAEMFVDDGAKRRPASGEQLRGAQQHDSAEAKEDEHSTPKANPKVSMASVTTARSAANRIRALVRSNFRTLLANHDGGITRM